jgi:hypothetical protein
LTIFSDAYPSPYGLLLFTIFEYSTGSFKRRATDELIYSVSDPTSFATPASTPSGRSVVFRKIRRGILNEGASS